MHQLGVGVLECWRRGWDSNPERLLETRNLLISRSDQNAGTACAAGVRYKKGTKREHSKRQNRNDGDVRSDGAGDGIGPNAGR